ncbi:zinc-dependent metalloprotease, partial [Streptosporangium canum]|uniref:zinc-dependent metalloprotease n=1 Tax=Streptosporangium canum TaxID=324952 RepID=UPI00342FFC07
LEADRGVDGRDAVWGHPDLMPTADDLGNPEGFVRGEPEFDLSGLEASLREEAPAEDDEDGKGGKGDGKGDAG